MLVAAELWHVRLGAHVLPKIVVKRPHPADRVGPIGVDFVARAGMLQAWERQKRLEMLFHSDRSRARSAAAVRSRKTLMQVELYDVRAHVARLRNTKQCVHVR